MVSVHFKKNLTCYLSHKVAIESLQRSEITSATEMLKPEIPHAQIFTQCLQTELIVAVTMRQEEEG